MVTETAYVMQNIMPVYPEHHQVNCALTLNYVKPFLPSEFIKVLTNLVYFLSD